MKKIHKILIYRIGNLGDTVCAIPAMVAVRYHFPDAWIGLLTNKETTGNPNPEEILKENDFLDDIITYSSQRVREPRYLWNLLRRLRSLQPTDLFIYLSISKSTRKRLIRDWLFFRFAGFRKLIGFKLPRPVKTYDRNAIRIPVFCQEADRLMSLLSPLGIDTTNVEFRLPIKKKHIEAVNTLWKHSELENRTSVMAICPGAKFSNKRWPVERFVQLISLIQKQFKVKILLIGGLSEKNAAEKILENAGNSIINLVGKTDYMESAEVIRRCKLMISNDCGPVHLAAAVGTPVVGIYSSRDFPGIWHPWGKNHAILRNDSVPCRFCFLTECKTNQCLNGITVEQVAEACRKYL
jgi:ADP-heptose:LPS heptosyltransferase